MRLGSFEKILANFIVVLLICSTRVYAGDVDQQVNELIKELEIAQDKQPVREYRWWKKPEKVVIFMPDNRIPERADYKTWLQSAAGDAELVFVKSVEELELEKEDTEVYLGFCHHVTADMQNLHWMQNYYVGVDRCTNNQRLLENNVLLTNTKAIPGPGMAEHTMALILMLSRKMTVYYQQQQNATWRRIPDAGKQVLEVKGKTILIVGLGGIGKQVALRAYGLGMKVIGIRNSSRSGPEYVEYVGLPDELLELAGRADVVVNITPLTRETKGMYNRAFFRAMKPTAIFINIGRGKSVITDDLLQALKNGEIAGAGLDVTDPEPLPAEHPLWKFPNVLITPHNSAPSDKMSERFWLLVRENLRRYCAGEPMLNVVNLKRGY